MKIPLTQGKFAIVGPRDYKYLMQWKWYYDNGYAVRNDYTNGHTRVRMHRVVLERMGFKDFPDSDHINRNRLDNRRGNLRAVVRSQNIYNSSKRKDNTSGYKGVSWHRRHKKWYSTIMLNGKHHYLGQFDDKVEAAQAYNEAAKECHGKFAVLNKLPNDEG